MTNDALKLFVGRYVMVQFREQQWMVPHEEGGKAAPTAMADPADARNKVPLVVPFLVAKLVERDGHMLFQYMDYRIEKPTKMETIVNPDVLFTVSAVSEERLITAP